MKYLQQYNFIVILLIFKFSSIANFDGGSFHQPDKWLQITTNDN